MQRPCTVLMRKPQQIISIGKKEKRKRLKKYYPVNVSKTIEIPDRTIRSMPIRFTFIHEVSIHGIINECFVSIRQRLQQRFISNELNFQGTDLAL